jgi:hypothetical protein
MMRVILDQASRKNSLIMWEDKDPVIDSEDEETAKSKGKKEQLLGIRLQASLAREH